MKQVFLISIFLIFSNFLFGQYVDTLKFPIGNSAISISSTDKKQHGQTKVIKQYKGELLEIHRSSFKREVLSRFHFSQDGVPITFILQENEANYFSLPDSFQSGVDSVFRHYTGFGKPPYLHKLIELFDRKATAKITYYNEYGKIESVYDFVVDTIAAHDELKILNEWRDRRSGRNAKKYRRTIGFKVCIYKSYFEKRTILLLLWKNSSREKSLLSIY